MNQEFIIHKYKCSQEQQGINTIRMYNVVKQSYDQDPNGIFIKRWVPELKKLPVNLLHEPWEINFLEEKEYNFKLNKNYYEPIIDNKLDQD